MSVPPSEIWLFRIVHYHNVEYILRHGMYVRGHPQQDPNYIFIGDTILTTARHDYPVPVAGYGNLGEYVPFYFWPLSPMLLNIKTGWRGITQRPQRDIVYICCRLEDLRASAQRILFTDGHAKTRTSRFYTDFADLDKLDWSTIRMRYWTDPEDEDRQRRKQAELLVQEHVKPECIRRIIVFDEQRCEAIASLLRKTGHTAQVQSNPTNFYFHE